MFLCTNSRIQWNNLTYEDVIHTLLRRFTKYSKSIRKGEKNSFLIDQFHKYAVRNLFTKSIEIQLNQFSSWSLLQIHYWNFFVIFCSLQTRFLEQRRNERNEKKEHKHHLIKCKYNLLLAMSRKSFAWSSNDDRFWRNLNTDYKWYSINFSSSIWFPDVNSSQKRGLYSLDHSRMVLRSRFHWMISFN